MTMKRSLLAALLALVPSLLPAEEVVLQQGSNDYTGVRTTIIIAGSRNADNNYGGLASVLVGAGASVERRALVFFDLKHLAGAKVTEDAILELTQTNVRGFEEGMMEVGIFAIAPANAGWNAGEGRDAAAKEGEVTWNHRAAGASPLPWAGLPGLSKADTDYAEAPIAILEYQVPAPSPTTRVAIPQDLIQQWIDQPESNAGLMLKRLATPDAPPDAMGGFISVHHVKTELTPKLILQTDQ